MEFNEKLQELRKSKSLTQEELAEATGRTGGSSVCFENRNLKMGTGPRVSKH